MATCEAPSTPPRLRTPDAVEQQPQLLTPPLTGGFKKHVRFLDELNDRVTKNYIGGKQLQPGYLSPVYKTSVPGIDAPPSTPSAETSAAANASRANVEAQGEAEIENSQPFPFMLLPLHIRTRIYTLLLTVPGLLCARQNRTPGSYATGAYIGCDERHLLPGISFVLHQHAVDGMKSRFSRAPYTNVAILRTSSEVYAEAREILYAGNEWEMANLTRETAPPVDYGVKLFPPGVSRMVRRITLKARALYGFRYILREGGYAKLKNVYRGLEQLTLVLEVENLNKGIGRKLGRADGDEVWEVYVQRVKKVMEREIFDGQGSRKAIPGWIAFKVMFPGDVFGEEEKGEDEEEWNKWTTKKAAKEAFELFKKATAA